VIVRTAFVDEQLMARGFDTGDVVRRSGLRDAPIMPFVGRVLYAVPDTGVVVVQWPWGVANETPSELVKDISGDFVPVLADQSDHTWESERNKGGPAEAKWRNALASRVAEIYEAKTLPIWRAACEAMYCGMDEVEAFIRMSAVFGAEYGQDAIRLTVSNLYEAGRRTYKIALYWSDPKRRYKVTKKEKSTGKYACPRCKGMLRPRVFRQGQKTLNCKTCGFCIHPEDLLHPGAMQQAEQQDQAE
jgi:hypothetical protein